MNRQTPEMRPKITGPIGNFQFLEPWLWYLSEVLFQGASNEYSQYMLSWTSKNFVLRFYTQSTQWGHADLFVLRFYSPVNPVVILPDHIFTGQA